MTGKTWSIWRPEPNFAEYWDRLLYNPQYQECFGKTGMNWIPTYDPAAAGHDWRFQISEILDRQEFSSVSQRLREDSSFSSTFKYVARSPVRGDVAEEDNDPDHAAQFCVNMRSTSAAQSSVWGRFLDEVYPIHAESVRQLETGDHAPATWILYFAQFRLTTSTIKMFCVTTRLCKPVMRSKTLAIHMCLSEEDLQWTLTPRFSRVRNSCFRKFAGSPPRIKPHHLDPSMDKRTKIIR